MRDRAARILAHRGLAPGGSGANDPEALIAAIRAGYGIETDLRDHSADLVISHDPANSDAVRVGDLLHQVAAILKARDGWLAFNIKSDGLAPMLRPILKSLPTERFFFFDMSFPQLLTFVREGLPVAVRVSEYEPLDLGIFERFNIPTRIWLDAFHSDWWMGDPVIDELASSAQAQIFIVSPELHGRDPKRVWEWFNFSLNRGDDVFLCTDHSVEIEELIS